MNIKNKKGQSTVEYVLLVTAVVAVAIAFLASPSSMFKQQLNSSLNSVVSDMNSLAGSLADSQHQQTADAGGNVTPPYSINVTNGVGSN